MCLGYDLPFLNLNPVFWNFIFGGGSGAKNLNLSDLNDYANLTSLSIMPASSVLNTVKIGDISSLSLLNNVRIRNVSVIDLRNLPLKKLTSLELDNCSISSIYDLKDCNLLEYLNLNNNPLQEISYGSDGDSMNSVQILVNLRNEHNLRKLHIVGNKFTSTQRLKDLSWDEHTGF